MRKCLTFFWGWDSKGIEDSYVVIVENGLNDYLDIVYNFIIKQAV